MNPRRPTITTTMWWVLSVVVSAAALLTTSCGGGSSGSASTSDSTSSARSNPATTDPATTDPATTDPVTVTSDATTSTVDPRPIDETALQLANLANFHEEDFGEGWSAYSPSGPSGQSLTDSTACGWYDGGPLSRLTHGAAQDGPTMQLRDVSAFVTSRVFVFPEEIGAIEFAGIANSEGYADCLRTNLENNYNRNSTDHFTVAVATRTDPNLGTGGFEAYVQLSTTNAAGEVLASAVVSVYRVQRVVIIVFEEEGALELADHDALFAASYQALVASYGRVSAAVGV